MPEVLDQLGDSAGWSPYYGFQFPLPQIASPGQSAAWAAYVEFIAARVSTASVVFRVDESGHLEAREPNRRPGDEGEWPVPRAIFRRIMGEVASLSGSGPPLTLQHPAEAASSSKPRDTGEQRRVVGRTLSLLRSVLRRPADPLDQPLSTSASESPQVAEDLTVETTRIKAWIAQQLTSTKVLESLLTWHAKQQSGSAAGTRSLESAPGFERGGTPEYAYGECRLRVLPGSPSVAARLELQLPHNVSVLLALPANSETDLAAVFEPLTGLRVGSGGSGLEIMTTDDAPHRLIRIVPASPTGR